MYASFETQGSNILPHEPTGRSRAILLLRMERVCRQLHHVRFARLSTRLCGIAPLALFRPCRIGGCGGFRELTCYNY